ncbi:hypothetical protein [Marinactinospora rubrisoli]|uniref:Ornithine cyclodeaminase n=1 Tax=Marinactinospora rubrisoli TaxID=2715399 RepID=A0ABW2KDL0_9ACTN
MPVETVGTARAAAARAAIVVLATWSRRPLIHAADLRPGTHFTALGADEPGKIELAGDVLRAARTVDDDIGLSLDAGALAAAGLRADAVHATMGEILRGERPGRVRADEITVYAPVGLPWQDLALAWPVYRAAVAAGAGVEIDFLS